MRRLRLVILIAGLATLGGAGLAQTAPGTQVTNVALCSHGGGGGGPSPGFTTIPSNPATTLIGGALCFATGPQLSVSPAGTVAPGTPLTYTLAATAPAGFGLSGVRLRLPLDPGLQDPASWTATVAPLDSGGSVSVVGSYDALGRSVEWLIPSLPAGETVRVRATAAVDPALAADSLIAATGEADAGGCTAPLQGNTVVTPVVPAVLRVAKSADRGSAAPGDAIGWTLVVSHVGSAPDLDPVTLVDRLPEGLRFVAGSVRVDATPAPDPLIAADGRTLRFPLGAMAPGESRVLRFFASVVPGARTGDALNVGWADAVTAGGAALRSPNASAAVRIVAGPFHTETTLVGRVFVDRDGDRLADGDEPGLAGVLVLMEHGKGAVTDISGRWHIEGVRPGLHTLRLDRSTLPPGLEPLDGGHEFAGSRWTRFVEARASTLVVADFPLGPQDAPWCELRAGDRRLPLAAAALLGEGGAPRPAAALQIERGVAWLQALPGAGSSAPTVHCSDGGDEPSPHGALQRFVTRFPGEHPTPGDADVAPAAAGDPFDAVLRTVTPGTHILWPPDDSSTGERAVHVDVVYPLDARPRLTVNGRPVEEERIGTRSVLPARGLAAARFVGVALEVGENRILLSAGADAEPVEHTIRVAGPAVGLRLVEAVDRWVADGVTPPLLRVEAIDAGGMRSPESRVVTLTVEGAGIADTDDDPLRDGFQLRLRHGAGRLRLEPTTTPGRVRVFAVSERLEQEAWLEVLARADRWTVLGHAEARVAGAGGVEGDGGSIGGGDGRTDDGGRLAVFARGPLGEAARLTVSVDTARHGEEERLFGRNEPDRFYPVGGDESSRTEEAPSRGPLFARIDGDGGFVQWGDFASGFDRTELLRYDRRLEGLSGRADAGMFRFEAFGAETEQVALRDVFAADGTSGPFLLSRSPVIARSEVVVVETRDRHETTRVLDRKIRLADVDYNLDPLAGTLLFRAPVLPYDRDGNPLRIVVLYEARGAGKAQVVGGGRVSLRRGTRFESGLSAIYEERGGEDLRMFGLDLAWQPGAGTSIRAEVARSDQASAETAWRLDVRSRPTHRLAWDLAFRDLPAGFANPGLLAAPELGMRAGSAKLIWEAGEHWRVRGEALFQDDRRVGLERRLLGVDAERRFGAFAAVGGLRVVASESAVSGDASGTQAIAGLRGNLGQRWTAELRHERSLDGEAAVGFPDRTAAALGFRLSSELSLYLRQELESGDGPTRDRTVLGLESKIGANTRAVQQVSLEGGFEGSALRSLSGVETVWKLGDRNAVRLSAGRLDTIEGLRDRDYASFAGGWERRAGPSFLSSRYELRLGERNDRHLLTAAGAFRLSPAWTAFVRERFFVTDDRGPGEAHRSESLLGAAYRPLGGRWQLLARAEGLVGSGTTVSSGAGNAGSAFSEPLDSTAPAAPGAPAGIGTAPGRAASIFDRDRMSLSLAAGARLSARQRVALTGVWSRHGDDPDRALPSSTSWLVSAHYTAQVHRRWTVGGSLRRFGATRERVAAFGHGVEAGFLALRDLWLVAGYNFAGVEDERFASFDESGEGPFFGVRFKFDESSLAGWFRRDGRLDRD